MVSPEERNVYVRVVQTEKGKRHPLPRYETEQAAGMDLVAALDEEVVLAPGARALISTGLCLEIPAGHEAQIRPRSGLALKKGLTVLNAPGTIDADYRGEVGVILINLGNDTVVVKDGERIAQLILAPVTRAKLVAVSELAETKRGAGGFGHTGSTV